MGIKGFPTLKIVKPGKKAGRPIVEDYQGERTAKAIVDAVVDKIPNLVKRVDDKTLESWLAEANDTAKAILFSDKGKTSALLKAIAIDFKGSIAVAQIRNTDKEKASLELFGITKFPTLLLLPGGKEAQGIVYEGELKKDAMVKFLSQVAAPNPDPAPPKAKVTKSKSKEGKKATKEKAEFESASKSHKKEDSTSAAASTQKETVVSDEKPTESPSPQTDHEKPAHVPEPAPPIGIIYSKAELELQCLGPKTGTCLLVFLPETPNPLAASAIGGLSEIEWRDHLHNQKRFPFYALPRNNPEFKKVHDALKLGDEVEIVALSAKRGWWRNFPIKGDKIALEDVTEERLESFIDAVRLGEGSKSKLPEGLVPEEKEEPVAAEEPEPAAQKPLKEEPKEKTKSEDTKAKETETKTEEKKTEETHDEL